MLCTAPAGMVNCWQYPAADAMTFRGWPCFPERLPPRSCINHPPSHTHAGANETVQLDLRGVSNAFVQPATPTTAVTGTAQGINTVQVGACLGGGAGLPSGAGARATCRQPGTQLLLTPPTCPAGHHEPLTLPCPSPSHPAAVHRRYLLHSFQLHLPPGLPGCALRGDPRPQPRLDMRAGGPRRLHLQQRWAGSVTAPADHMFSQPYQP
jgi:hypothetical protein